ncbi:hypothetical protein FBU30_000831 [Linnemannia zychae]|nr:hypothetical protein FBU30_000831 [Linnemannia zychae]
MTVRRTKTTKPVATKRTKATIYRESESESGAVDERATKSVKRRVVIQNPAKYYDPPSDEDDSDAFIQSKRKPQQPRPKRKTVNSANSANSNNNISSSSSSTTVSTAAKTPTLESSVIKQKSQTSTLSDIANTLYKNSKSNNVISGNANSESSILKLKKNSLLENQENMDAVRLSKDGNNKAAKRVARSSSTNMSQEQLATALDDLREKYQRLQQLRETDAERNLADCREQLNDAIRSAANYRAKIEPQLESALRSNEKLRENNEIANAKVRTLQRQVRDFEHTIKQRDQEDRIKAKTASMESVLASPEVTPNTASIISIIKMYENLSGFKLVPRDFSSRSNKDKIPAVWDCEHSGPRGTLRFTLTYDYAMNMVTYVPKIEPKRDEKLLKNLPDYLMDEIEFDREFESKFFWRILNFNNDDDA